ncbi:metal ABC transporter substrate-binding protein [bacterium]|nr:metal ABC transporter substrate-binding protein [bacterium]
MANLVQASHVNVVTSTTDLAWLVKEIGSPHVQVTSLLKGTENPHYVDAVPEFIRLVSNANIVCVIGLDLEVGWMPKVLSRSGNAQVQPGGRGYCETGKTVQVLEKPLGGVDRSLGDVHPSGNPHFWLSPKHLAQAISTIVDALAGVDPNHAVDYVNKAKEVSGQLEALSQKNREKLKPIVARQKGPLIIEYHKEFSYLFDSCGLTSFGSIEEKPGVTPSAGRLVSVALAAKNAGIKVAIASENAPKQTLSRFTELSGIPVVQVPMSLQPAKGLTSYVALQEKLVDSIVKHLAGGVP